jgi:hypothetical protein
MAKFEAAIGRYVWLEIQGVEYRVYFEEAGQGIPLICQHTAGSDGKQWVGGAVRQLDGAYIDDFHGRSSRRRAERSATCVPPPDPAHRKGSSGSNVAENGGKPAG